MKEATENMKNHIEKLNIKNGKNSLISNVTAEPVKESSLIKNLLIKQIEIIKMA